MEKSKNDKVQKFLDDISMIDPEKFGILEKLRRIVFVEYPKTNENDVWRNYVFSGNRFWRVVCKKKSYFF